MNIFDLPQFSLTHELTTVLAENKNVRIERIIGSVSTGQVSDWYDQEESEFVILLEGDAKIEFENDRIVGLSRGDTLLIKPHEKHRVCYTSNEPICVWLCVFFTD